MPIYQLEDKIPTISSTSWVDASAHIIGEVILDNYSSVWYNTVIRGDNSAIYVGTHSNVQDGCILHSDVGLPIHIGNYSTIGHGVILHSCTVGEGTLIGMRSVILNHAKIGKGSLVAAGSLVPEGKEFPDGCLLMGNPAKCVRLLTIEDQTNIARAASHYVEKAMQYRFHLKEIKNK